MEKNEIVEVENDKIVAISNAAELSAFLNAEIGTSALMVGTKFSSEDLINAETVTLLDFDWVDYIKDEGTSEEQHVHFSVWSVLVEHDTGANGVIAEEGYYQAGTVFNKIARALERNPAACEAFRQYGQKIRCSWGQTSSKNKIVLVSIVD